MIADIWASFRSLPPWVQLWVAVILVPVNLAPLAFLDQPQGVLIAGLAVIGMALNIPIMVTARGMSGAMALPHLLCWTPLVIIVAAMLLMGDQDLTPAYMRFLALLLVIDVISLVFDAKDARDWLQVRNKKAP